MKRANCLIICPCSSTITVIDPTIDYLEEWFTSSIPDIALRFRKTPCANCGFPVKVIYKKDSIKDVEL